VVVECAHDPDLLSSELSAAVHVMIYKGRIVVVHRQRCIIERRKHISPDIPNV